MTRKQETKRTKTTYNRTLTHFFEGLPPYYRLFFDLFY